jgi:hypothetical protein
MDNLCGNIAAREFQAACALPSRHPVFWVGDII